MSPADAIDLINHSSLHSGVQQWADLGAGTGTFTDALAELVAEGSTIYAIDNDAAALKNIKETKRNITVRKIRQDFTIFPLPFTSIDGIVMANSLHYVKDQLSFLQQLKTYLQPQGILILVEYDTDSANRWVPYPFNVEKASRLTKEAGFNTSSLLGRKPSVYQSSIYSLICQ